MEKYYMAALGGAEGLGHKSIARLVEYFGNAENAWSAQSGEMLRAGIKRNVVNSFITFRREHPDAPEKLRGYCDRQKINLCCISDEDYPPILKDIPDRPTFFYYRGKLEPLAQRIAIVGSRQNTAYGQNVALELSEELAAAGFTIVSGAARGIDTFAHRGALKAGRTVAVLGCGINYIYPPENKNLFTQIVENGGVVMSEFHPQMSPNHGTFPARNRIIAGLSRGVIIVEAGESSGAKITVDRAIDYSRDVFAIPGDIYAEKSVGCNELIRKGATLIKGARDVLKEWNIAVSDETKFVELDEIQAQIFKIIPTNEFITDDEILMQLDDLSPDELASILLELELKECVESFMGRYKRKTIKIQKPVAKIVNLDGAAKRVFEIIPPDKFITDDEILMKLDDLDTNELSGILLELELKNCVEQDAGRYKRK